jgi:hypothetical protein
MAMSSPLELELERLSHQVASASGGRLTLDSESHTYAGDILDERCHLGRSSSLQASSLKRSCILQGPRGPQGGKAILQVWESSQRAHHFRFLGSLPLTTRFTLGQLNPQR